MIKKVPQKPQKKVPKHSKEFKKLTKTEAEVLYLRNVEYLTNRQISIRRGTSERAVRRTVENIKKKGLFNAKAEPSSAKRGGVSQKRNFFWRLHKLHFVVKPYHFFPRYDKMRLNLGGYSVEYRDWVVTFHKDLFEVRLKALKDFRDEDKFKCLGKGQDSLRRSLFELSNKYGFEVFKDGKLNIKLVDHHLAFTNSAFSEAVKEPFLSIKGVDGKVWFSVDNSKGEREHEYVHSQRAVSDSERLEPYLNDFRDNLPLSNSDLQRVVSEITVLCREQQKEINSLTLGLRAVVELLKPRELSSEVSVVKPDYVG